MGFFQLRRARMRGLKEGKVQTVRMEATDNAAHDAVERHQDYGFAGNPVDGQGLVIHVDGHTVVIRKDRLAERPQLGAYEVSVWHKEGHKITLKDGKLIEVLCDHYVVKAAIDTTIETPLMTIKASTKLRVESPLHEMTGLLRSQNFTLGLTSAGTMTVSGGNINYSGVATTYTGGTLTYNGKNLTDTHTHTNVQTGAGNSGGVT